MWIAVVAIYTILCFLVANGMTIFHAIGILSILTIMNLDIGRRPVQPPRPPRPEDDVPLEVLMELLEAVGNIPQLE